MALKNNNNEISEYFSLNTVKETRHLYEVHHKGFNLFSLKIAIGPILTYNE